MKAFFITIFRWLLSILEKPEAQEPSKTEDPKPVEPPPTPKPVEETGPGNGVKAYAKGKVPAFLPSYNGDKSYSGLKNRYAFLFATATITNASRTDWYVSRILKNRARYEAVEAITGVPWWLIGCIHGMEASFDFSAYLGNGEPLNRVTRLVPKGRGPFRDWETGAVDALGYDGLAGVKDWTLEKALHFAEKYNGFGYYQHGINSPYLWSCTQHWSKGKYVADGKFDADADTKQCGVAAMIKRLEMQGAIQFKEVS